MADNENRARLSGAIDKNIQRVDLSAANEMSSVLRGDAPIRMSPHVQDRGVGSARISPAVNADLEKLSPETANRVRDFTKRK
jgi:hypothetical protein